MWVEKETIPSSELPKSFRSVWLWPCIPGRMVRAVYLNGRKLEQPKEVRLDEWSLWFVHESVLRWNQCEGDMLIVETKDKHRFQYVNRFGFKDDQAWKQLHPRLPDTNPSLTSSRL